MMSVFPQFIKGKMYSVYSYQIHVYVYLFSWKLKLQSSFLSHIDAPMYIRLVLSVKAIHGKLIISQLSSFPDVSHRWLITRAVFY